MRARTVALSLILLCCTVVGFAQNDSALPQVVDGQFNGGSFRTTFIASNSGTSIAVVTITLSRDDASPMVVTIPGSGTNSTFVITLNPGETRILQTDGSGPVATGAGKVTSSQPVTVSAIFTLFSANGNIVTEAGVGSSQPMTSFVLPVDTTGTFNTGLALFNAGNSSATITLRLLNTAGQQLAQITITLAAGAHTAKFVSGAGEFFPAITNIRGTLVVSSTVPIVAVTLRQNSSPITFTTLPVVPTTSTKTSFNLPQIANGFFAGGSFRTTLIAFSMSTSPATVTITLTRDDGSPLTVTIPGRGTASTFTITLQPGESFFLQTDGTGPLSTGAARVTSTAAIGVSAIFTAFGASGNFVTEAGVGDSPALSQFTIPVDTTGIFNTGVAFFNQNQFTVTLTLRLLDQNGVLAAPAQTRTLNALQHLALFIQELFAGIQNFRGSLSVIVTSPVSAVTLRQISDPLTFTTVPVGTGAFVGTAPPTAIPPLLMRVVNGVNATTDQTLNVTLPPGFRLSGTIRGPIRQGSVVIAKDGSNIFASGVNPATSKYLIVLPAGTYSLIVCYDPQGPPVAGQNNLTFDDPQVVTVNADTTRDITITPPALFAVSGTVTGLSTLPTFTQPFLIFTSNDNKWGGIFTIAGDGRYQGQLPSGSYRVSLIGNAEFSVLQRQNLAIFNIGSLTVSGAAATGSFTVPATARLSGAFSGLTGYGDFPIPVLLATDKSAELPTTVVCNFPPFTNASPGDLVSNLYQMVLATGRTYQLAVIISIIEGEKFIGSVTFPEPPQELAFGADTTRNFQAPVLPGRVVVSGKVTDNAGQGVDQVSVIGTTKQLTGGISAMFTGFTQTDSSGNYRMTLLSGTNYTIFFVPRTPQP